MRVLLISANTEQINMPVMPLGLACVKQAVDAAGHRVQALNLMAAGDAETLVPEAVKSLRPEVIGISVRNIDDQALKNTRFLLKPVAEIVNLCRSLSTAPIVLGGAGYSIFPSTVLDYLKADYGIRGEGEALFVQLLHCLEHNMKVDELPELYRPGKSPAKSLFRYVQPINAFPLPVPDVTFVAHGAFNATEIWLPFQTRRGCGMACSYCSTPAIEGRKLRLRDPEAVMAALRQYTAAGFRQFFFTDNTFNLPKAYAKKLCRMIIRERLEIKWQAIMYPRFFDSELVGLMAQAGCVQVSMGFESGSAKILRRLRKRFAPDDVEQLSRMLYEAGIRRMGFLLLGGPGETRETVLESLAFAEKIDTELMRLTAGIRIYPQTELARIARAQTIIDPDDDLLRPRFYLEQTLADWLPEVLTDWKEKHPGWIY